MVVPPGLETSTTLTVRNDSDIVEAYEFDVVGDCAPWTSVEPARLSLYPGTSERVTVLLRPPRSPEVLAGETPLGVRVLPVERPTSVVVAETTVLVEPFGAQRVTLVPERRRAWRGARYRVEARNEGNTPVTVSLAPAAADDQIAYRVEESAVVQPGAETEVGVRVRVGKLLWFGKPVDWPLRLTAVADAAGPVALDRQEHDLDGEFVQLPLLPKWLLALAALLLALILAWLALVRPAVRSAAREAADDRAQEIADVGRQEQDAPPPPPAETPNPPPPQQEGGGQETGPGTGSGGGGQQSSSTIEVRTNAGDRGTGSYTVPEGKVFRVTDILVANHQGDEGVVTIVFGDRVITTIALETFRNQDYHWVTPIDIPENAAVSVEVGCARPGTPASGRQARNCLQLLNVSGELADLPR